MTSNLTSRAGSSRRPREGRVTIATNMAGRGTDIKLGYGVEEIGGCTSSQPNRAKPAGWIASFLAVQAAKVILVR